MARFYDVGRSDKVFQVGDWVYVKLQPYRQVTVSARRDYKLAPKFYGPYQVVERIKELAYRLDLPAESRIHPVFHVSMLKAARGAVSGITPALPATTDNPGPQPVAILERRVRKGREQVLVHWTHTTPADATWDDLDHLQIQFPGVLGDKNALKGGGM
ncbi:hypothetical protein LINGRAHAP2_LOCUS23386 [Linum grandiflorum]